MKFTYKGRNKEGVVVAGVVEDKDKSDAISHIKDLNISPIFVTQKKGLSFNIEISIFNGVKLNEKIIFTKNLSGMLKAGLPLSRALQVLEKQTTNVYFKRVINAVLDNIDKGGTFSDGLAKFPKVFSPLFVSMVRSGEESGGLPTALSEIGINLEKTYGLNRKIKSAMMYPSVIISAIFLIGILMFIYVVPTLTKTFKELNVQLPWSTRLVIGISDLLANHLVFVVLGLLVLVLIGIVVFKNEKTRKMIDYASVRVPVLGVLLQEVNSARTTRTMSSLLASGVSIGRAISITEEVLQNFYYKQILKEVETVVQKGGSISSVFKKNTKLYPVMVGEMMEVGEETGKLSDMLSDIALFYEGEVDAKTKDLSTIIEPVLMIFIGAAVGFFAISMLTPMYSIMDSIK